jgi:hypothetical protein
MRTPEQLPAIQIYTNPKILHGASHISDYPNYEQDGGGTDYVSIGTFRHPDLRAFLFDAPHTPEKVLDFVARFLE